MAENQTVTTPEVIDGKREIPSDDYLKAIHDMTEAVKSGTDDLKGKIGEMMSDVRDAAKKNTQLLPSAESLRPDKRLSLKTIVDYPAVNDLERDIQDANNAVWDAHLYKSLLHRMPNVQFEYHGIKSTEAYERLQDLRKKAAGDLWDTDVAGTEEGEEWVPTGYTSQVIDFARVSTNVIAAMPQVTVPQGMQTMRIPVKTSRAEWIPRAEYPTATETLPAGVLGSSAVSMAGTNFLALTPVKHRGVQGMTVEMVEDAAVATMQIARQELLTSGMESLESGIINGQATEDDANLDGSNGPNPANGYQNGFRFYGVSTNANLIDGGGAALTVGTVEDARKTMGIFGIRPSEVILIVHPANYIDIVNDPLVKTVDVFGPQATIRSGQVAAVHGIPILVSNEVPTNLTAATGDANAGGGATTTAVLANVSRWRFGVKRAIQLTVVNAVADDVVAMFGFTRTAVAAAPPITDNHVAIVRNITTT